MSAVDESIADPQKPPSRINAMRHLCPDDFMLKFHPPSLPPIVAPKREWTQLAVISEEGDRSTYGGTPISAGTHPDDGSSLLLETIPE
jgi:hypothetical protein